MYQQQGYPSRSPPPLQHPIPTHPPFQVPDPPVSPNPGPRQSGDTDPHVSSARSRSAASSSFVQGGYQRFSSPPIQSTGSQPGGAYAPSFGQSTDAYAPSQQSGAGNFYSGPASGAGAQSGQSQQANWGGFPGFGAGGSGMMNDATAQMGVQFGQHVAQVGGEYVQRNFNALLPMPVLKHYFNVSNSYVLHKLRLVLFPWRHKPWSRAHRQSNNGGAYSGSPEAGNSSKSAEGYLPPRDDVNSPDLYIPRTYSCPSRSRYYALLVTDLALLCTSAASSHGICHLHPTHFHDLWPRVSLPSRDSWSDCIASDGNHCGRAERDQAGHISAQHSGRPHHGRPVGLLWVQVCWHSCHAAVWSTQRPGAGVLVCVPLHFGCQCIFPGTCRLPRRLHLPFPCQP